MTFKEMRSRLEYMVGDITGEAQTQQTYNLYLNSAQQKLCKLGLVTNRRATCNTVADQNDYMLPAYVYKLLQVEVYDSDNSYYVPIVGRSFEWLNKNNATWRGDSSETKPTNYALMGSNWLIVYPAFDAEVSAGIRIYYEREGDTLSADDNTSYVKSIFHSYIVLQAFVDLFPSHKDTPKYEQQLVRGYNEMIQWISSVDLGMSLVQKPGG